MVDLVERLGGHAVFALGLLVACIPGSDVGSSRGRQSQQERIISLTTALERCGTYMFILYVSL